MSAQPGGRMPLIEHFREFRRRVFRSAIAITLGAVVGWVYYTPIVNKLASPVCDLSIARKSGATHCGTLYIDGVLGPLNLQIKVAILVGVILAAPLWIYQLWAFVAPALHRKEKIRTILFIICAIPFFALGAGLGYWILPIAVRVLLGFTPGALTNLVKFDNYLDFVLRVILLFGFAFELPVFLLSLNLIGLVSGKAILKPWRFAVFGIALFTAIFTPTGDPLSMGILAFPLIFFYFAAGGIAVIVDKRRVKKSARELADEK
jgi:sec-independent protein translocase protein TatC